MFVSLSQKFWAKKVFFLGGGIFSKNQHFQWNLIPKWILRLKKMYTLIYVKVKIQKLQRSIDFKNSGLTPLLNCHPEYLKSTSLDETIRYASKWFITTQKTQNLKFVNFNCIAYAQPIPRPLESRITIITYQKKRSLLYEFEGISDQNVGESDFSCIYNGRAVR